MELICIHSSGFNFDGVWRFRESCCRCRAFLQGYLEAKALFDSENFIKHEAVAIQA